MILDIKNITFDEWIHYFVSRINNTPAQRYQEMKTNKTGYNHISNVHTIEEECLPCCRFWPNEGIISVLEILSDYSAYQDYEQVLKVWQEL